MKRARKTPRLQKVTINYSKSHYYYFESGQHLYQFQYGHEKKKKAEPNDKL